MNIVEDFTIRHFDRSSMATDFLSDPLWYKDAVIYELHVRSFFDANNDGFGDFAGLRQKMPYLESLGVNTLWLLPFLESPLRDDGYDTADYLKILPVHGTLDDFQDFLDEAHARGMRVITELVLNHTSDQHPWFLEARDPRSPKHDWYVWSHTTEKYLDTRIIFTDTEPSNWSWDRKAQKYYWHRFFSHQPDLNFDNPEVHEAMREVLFFWLDMGVDGLRLDAVPYLYEREGTNCENLPETIRYVKDLRQAIDERYGPGKVLLAEANQWPEDTLPYFGYNDDPGVQMAFNFPIMPRLYMALRRENRRPLVEMLELTKDIPDDAQWAIFLRNHDELTLEMVTDEERDYMYNEYAADSRFRINVGIRRRLVPLLEGDRRRVELINGLLMALKGSPVIYYGDEIGMGDDPFLGDRNGVRTPMQWSADKNGGFSRAAHHRLFMPPIDRGRYSYEFVNVEDAEADPHSLLHFTRRLLAQRRQHEKIFGRGTFELLPIENPQVLAFVRAYEGQKILVVANLSHFAQSTYLSPSEDYQDLVPVEMFGQSAFPKLTDEPYHMLLGPYGFYWFALKPEAEVVPVQEEPARPASEHERATLPVLSVSEGLHNLLVKTMVRDRGMEHLEALLPAYIKPQRWFGAKEQEIQSVAILDAVRLQASPFPVYLVVVRVNLPDSHTVHLMPLATAQGNEAEHILDTAKQAALAWIDGPGGTRSLLHDASVNPDFWRALFHWWQADRKARSLRGLYVPSLDAEARRAAIDTVRVFGGEQSNSSALLGDRYYVKLYRRVERGIHPEEELLTHLTRVGFPFIPGLHGTLTFRRPDQTYTLGILQDALPIDTDGWTYARTMTHRFLERVSGTTIPPEQDESQVQDPDEVPAWLEEVGREMLSLAHVLGIRTAELHQALAHADAPHLQPEPGTAEAAAGFLATVRTEAEQTRRLLADQNSSLDALPDDDAWDKAFDRLDRMAEHAAPVPMIRVHGDYHLGQVVRSTDGEFYILDFEGEPARSLAERRARDCSLRDVAGMLRSLEYAALSAWKEYPMPERHPDALETWIQRLTYWCRRVFIDAYYTTAGHLPFLPTDAFLPPIQTRSHLLWAYLLHKALYEVRYELSHRPSWIWLPLYGLSTLLEAEQPTTGEIDLQISEEGKPRQRAAKRTFHS